MSNYEQRAKETVERLRAAGHATILAIESSCDETAAAIVKDGREVVSSIISSQIPLHAMYGGVVPEIASRKHVESVDPVVDECLAKANMTLCDVDAIAVTYGPGLVGALLIGVSGFRLHISLTRVLFQWYMESFSVRQNLGLQT